jgi:ubiquinone/menaquinone biosynthesis C-methylase UbiE
MTLTTAEARELLLRLRAVAVDPELRGKRATIVAELARAGLSSPAEVQRAVGAVLREDPSLEAAVADVIRAYQFHGEDPVELSKRSYDVIFRRMEGERWFTFFNHGLAPLTAEEAAELPALSAEDDRWRHQSLLYLYLLVLARRAGRQSLAGLDLLDVGCGRGGGVSVMKRYHPLGRAVGLDLNANQVAFCRDRHRDVEVEFHEGNALEMPFPEASFDLVTNVESSHCYGDVPRFFREVHRVLRRGGLFLFTDIRAPLDLERERLLRQLAEAGFETAVEEDITARVARACEVDSSRFRFEVFGSEKAEYPRQIAREKYQVYSNRAAVYLAYALRRA